MRQRVLDDFAIPIYPQEFESRNMCFDVWIRVANLQTFAFSFVLLLLEIEYSFNTCWNDIKAFFNDKFDSNATNKYLK